MGIEALLVVSVLAQARVGVVALGTDPAAAGELQRAAEAKVVEVPNAAVANAGLLAERLTPPPDPNATPVAIATPDPAAIEEAKKLLDEAIALYYEDSAAQSLDRLGALAALQARTPGLAIVDRVRLRLWRMAVFLALGDKTGADGEAIAALKLDPKLVVDLSELPPSAKDALDAARAKYRVVTVLVNGIPPNSIVTIDDRPASARSEVITGTRHRVVVSAPGRRDVSGVFEAKADVALRMSLPLAFPEPVAKSLEALVMRGARAPEDEPMLAELASTLQVDWLVLAHAKPGAGGEARGMIVNLPAGGAALAATPIPWAPDAGIKLAEWAKETLTQAMPSTIVTAAATPVPTATPSGSRAGSGLSAGAGLAIAARNRSVKGANGGGYSTPFVGAGPEAFVSMKRGAWRFGGAAAFTSYDLSYVDVKMPDGTSKKVSGGSTLSASAGAWRVFGQDESRLSFDAGLALAWESHDASDVVGLGLLPSHTRIAPVLDAGARLPVRLASGKVLGIEAGVALSPAGLVQESPSGAMGKSPLGGPDLGWRAGATMTGGKYDLFFGYRGEMRTVSHSGTGTAPTQPDLRNTKVRETHHGMLFLLTKLL